MSKVKRIILVAVAALVMISVLIYYNFIDKALVSGVKIDDVCPTFSVRLYDNKAKDSYKATEEEFVLEAERGKFVVINFWATWCGPCKAELPHFDEFQKDYAEDVTIIALNGERSLGYEGLRGWINTNEESKDWKNFDILFGYYDTETNDLYKKLGFTSGDLPATVILDREGKIIESREGKMSYEELENIIVPLLKY